MSVYDNFKLSILDNNLTVSKDNIKLFDFTGDTNNSYQKLSTPEISFNDNNYGIYFDNSSKKITITSEGTIFTNDIYVSGKLNATDFPSNLVVLDKNNKINAAYIPTFSNNLTLTCNAIGIGVANALAKLHIKNGDSIIEEGRFGIGTQIPKYNFHLIKNDTMINTPSFVIENGINKIIDVFTEKETVIINNNNNIIPNSNIKLQVYGTTSTSSLMIGSNFIGDTNQITINNDFYVNYLNSSNNQIIVNSNIDFIVSNVSLKSIISNVIEMNDCFDIVNKKIVFSSNIYFDIDTTSNLIKIINNDFTTTITSNSLIIPTLTTSNINLLNYNSLTSNPLAESVFDIKGKMRLYNDTPYFILNCFTNNNNLYFTTYNNCLYSYNLTSKTFSTISTNFNYSIFKAKYNSYGFYNNTNNTLTINENSIQTIISNITIKDFSLNNNNLDQPLNRIVYYIDENSRVVSYNLTTLTSNINNLRNDIIRIETYFDNTYIALTSNNSLFHFNGTIFNPITFTNPQQDPLIIKDFSTGDNHTLILTESGNVWSCGYTNINTSTFKKGYQVEALSSNLALPVSLLTSPISKIKANNNSSVVVDNEGSGYIFGTVNKFFSTTTIFKIDKYKNLIDVSLNNNDVFLLTYYNDIITTFDVINNNTNNNTKFLILPIEFYGTSMKSKGSIVIGGANFDNTPPRNSLLVENFIGIGSSNLTTNNTSNYSLVVSGNINLIDGSIYRNGILLSSIGGSSLNSNSDTWIKNNNNIFYTLGNVGIGIANPSVRLHVDGTSIFNDDVYINGNLITKEYKPFVINKERNIYYNGLLGINNKNPQGSIHLFDGSFITSDTKYTSNLIVLNSFTSNVNSSGTLTSYINPILLNQNGDTIVSSFYNLDLNFNNNNNNNIEIYKLINNNWRIYRISDSININSSLGESISISKDGSSIFIGAYKERNINTNEIVGGIYRYYFDANSNLIKDSQKQTSFNTTDNKFYQIGRNINCSGDGSILISTVDNYTDLIYIKNLNTNITRFLDFSIYGVFHSSFSSSYTTNIFTNNGFSYNNITIDSSDTGSIIVINFIYNTTGGNLISSFSYFNFYIIKDFEVFLLKFTPNFNNIGNINANVTSVSISADSSKIFITTYNGFHYIYDFNFNLDKTSSTLIGSTVINFYDKAPTFVFFRKEDTFNYSHFRGKISKSGNVLSLGNTKSLFIYKLNKVDNSWNPQLLIPNLDQIPSINNYSISLDYEGFNCAVSYLRKLSDNITDTIQITNNYFNFLREKTNFILNNDALNLYMYSYFNSNIYAPYYFGDGSYLTDISQSNILSPNNKGIIYTSNNRYYNNDNFYWLDSNNTLYINSNIDCCNLLVKNIYINNRHTDDIYFPKSHHFTVPFGGTSLSNLTSNSFLVGNGQSPVILSSNLQWINRLSRLVFNDNATFIITSNPPIINVPFISNSHFAEVIATSNGGSGQNLFVQDSILFFSSNRFQTTRNLFWNHRGSNLNINSVLNVASDIYVRGVNISNIDVNNFTTVVPIYKGGTGIATFNDGWLLVGANSNQSNLSSYSNLRWDFQNSNLITCNITLSNINLSNITFLENFSNTSRLFIHPNSISDVIKLDKGGLGITDIKEGQLLFGLNSNTINVSSNFIWTNSNRTLELKEGTLLSSNIRATYFYGDGASISNLTIQSLTGIIPISKGGTGRGLFEDGMMVIGNNSNQLKTTSNLRWNELNLSLITCNIRSEYFYGDGSNLSNLTIENLTGIIPISKGGTGRGLFEEGMIVIGNDSNQLKTTSSLRWDELNSSLISCNIRSEYFYGDGSNITNLTIENLTGIVPISKGGTGRGLFEDGMIVIGNNSNQLKTTLNLRWDELNSNLITCNIDISSNLKIEGSNFYSIITNPSLILNSIGLYGYSNMNMNMNMSISNNHYNSYENQKEIKGGEIIYGYNSTTLDINSNLRWDNSSQVLEVKDGTINTSNIIANKIYLNGKDISIINTNDITGIIPANQGGTGLNFIEKGRILVGNDSNTINTFEVLKWDDITSTLLIDNIKINSNLTINNASLSTIIANIDSNLIVSNLGFNNNEIQGGELLFTVASNSLSINSNFKWNNDLKILEVNDGSFKTSNITGKNLVINGNIYSGGEIYSSSDVRLKTNISLINEPMKKLEQLNGVYYNLISNEKRCIGLIAQEVEKIIPEIVYTNIDDTKAIAYTNMMGLIVESIKELSQRIGKIEEKLNYININRI